MTTIQDWKDKEFLPWKAEMEKHLDERARQVARFKENAPQLQSIVAMLIEGRTKPAVLAWNTLQFHPKLKDIRVSGDGEALTLVATDGALTVLKLDEVLAEMQAMLRG